MKKLFFSQFQILFFLSIGLNIHRAFAERAPAISPIIEVSIENNNPSLASSNKEIGFDFSNKNLTMGSIQGPTRTPAQIATKMPKESHSYIGPFIFLLALPLALWITISKKMQDNGTHSKVDFYHKTFQFKPHKENEQNQDIDIDDDDHNYPKAA